MSEKEKRKDGDSYENVKESGHTPSSFDIEGNLNENRKYLRWKWTLRVLFFDRTKIMIICMYLSITKILFRCVTFYSYVVLFDCNRITQLEEKNQRRLR